MSIIRDNLMTQPGYSPYCGAERCGATWPRTRFDGEQFKCVCGWRSQFPADFMAIYKEKWHGGAPSSAAPAQEPGEQKGAQSNE